MNKIKYFYVYAVINFEQRKAYIGSRGSVKPPLEDRYMGSYDKSSGFEPTKKLILSEHASRKEAYESERKWQIKFDVAQSPLFINKGICTSSGFSSFGIKRTKEELQKKTIKIKNIKTKEILEFKSYVEASRCIGTCANNVGLLAKGKIRRSGNYVLAERDDEFILNTITTKKLLLQNTQTKEILEFRSRAEAAKVIGCSRQSITCLVSGKCAKINGYSIPGVDISKRKSGGHNKKQIWIKNILTKETYNFESQAEAARFIGCSRGNINLLTTGKVRRVKNYTLAPDPDSTDSQ